MKISKRQLRRIIKEELATINNDAIEDAVMGVLSDEGGAAGLDPIEDVLEDLEDDDVSLPDESIEDIIGSITGVKRHADGDYVDVTQLEVRKSSKQQLKAIKEDIFQPMRDSLKLMPDESRYLMLKDRATKLGLRRELARAEPLASQGDFEGAIQELIMGITAVSESRKPRQTVGRKSRMKITKRQLRQIIKETIEGEESYPAILEFDRVTKEGDLALRSWLKFMSRRRPNELQTIAELWDGMVANPGDVAAAKELAASLGINDSRIAGAATFHARKMSPGTDYPSGAELQDLVMAYRDESAKRRAANPPAPRPRKPYGGGTRNRPYDQST